MIDQENEEGPMRKNILTRVGIVVLFLWIVISLFAYLRHIAQEELLQVEVYVEFENYGVLVKHVEVYDYEPNQDFAFYTYNLNWLPEKLIYPAWRLLHFYRDPYVRLEHGPEYIVTCEVIPREGAVFDLEHQDLRMVMYDTLPVENYPQQGGGTSHYDKSNTVEYHVKGKWFDKDYVGISLKDYTTDELVEIPFTSSFVTRRYSYLNPKKSSNQPAADELCERFIVMVNALNIGEASKVIHSDYVEAFPWDVVESIDYEDIVAYDLGYVGPADGFDDVFELQVKVDNAGAVKVLNFEMIFDQSQWLIVDVE